MKIDRAHFRTIRELLDDAMNAATDDDIDEQARSIAATARALHAWAIDVRARLPKEPATKAPPTREERKAQRTKEFPDIGAKHGPKPKEASR